MPKIKHLKRGAGWLTKTLDAAQEAAIVDVGKVRERIRTTRTLGEQPLWSGYQKVEKYPFPTTGNRTLDQVRTSYGLGQTYAWLTAQRRADIVVEFGTAFGVSGMFWLTGMEIAATGRLMTYEPNEIWANIAEQNLAAISDRFILTRGIFEELAAETLELNSIDIAFIDAIHTSEFVFSQYELLLPFMKNDGIILFDDIDFSPDMKACWKDICRRSELESSAELGRRVGIVELGA